MISSAKNNPKNKDKQANKQETRETEPQDKW